MDVKRAKELIEELLVNEICEEELSVFNKMTDENKLEIKIKIMAILNELDIQEPNEVFVGSGTKSNRILFGNVSVISRLLDPPTRSNLTVFPAPVKERNAPPVPKSKFAN